MSEISLEYWSKPLMSQQLTTSLELIEISEGASCFFIGSASSSLDDEDETSRSLSSATSGFLK
jgi:hypothetical protein